MNGGVAHHPAFADLTDPHYTWTVGHSRGVAPCAAGAARPRGGRRGCQATSRRRIDTNAPASRNGVVR